MIGVDDRLVVALVALDRERPHPILAHVGKRHRLDRIAEARTGHRHQTPSAWRAHRIAGLSGVQPPDDSREVGIVFAASIAFLLQVRA
jgi:hypothetical protein